MDEGVVPQYGDWPHLPDEWVEALEAGSLHEEVFDGSAPNRSRSALAQVNMAIYQDLINRLSDNRAPDPLVTKRLEKALEDLTDGSGSRYDTTRDHVAGLMRLHSYGRVGLSRALEQLYPAYVMEVGDTRPQQVAEKEFIRFTQGAALLVSATKPDCNTKGNRASGKVEDSHDDQLSWEPIDLTPILSGEYQPLMPTLLARTDGQCLFYPGKFHSLHGESESAKSFVMQVVSVSEINDGNDVLYIDFDDDEKSVTGRLIELGADKEKIAKHFVYLRPEISPKTEAEQAAWLQVLSRKYRLCVIDGVNNAIGVQGLSAIDPDDIAAWIRDVPKKIAKRTGAAVVAIDHVTKDKINRGRWAIGPQAKMAGLDGAAYAVEVRKVLGRGLRGEISLRIGKDRPGGIRGNCGAARKSGVPPVSRRLRYLVSAPSGWRVAE